MAATESAAASAASTEAKEQAEDAKAKTAAKFAELAERLAAAKAELQSKLDAVGPLREAAVAAETARVVAEEAARKAARDQGPVSVFISRKCRRKKWGPQKGGMRGEFHSDSAPSSKIPPKSNEGQASGELRSP